MIYTTEGNEELTRDNILKYVSVNQLWNYYTETKVKHGKSIKGDPSAVYFITPEGIILLKDFAKQTYNIWTYLMNKFDKSFYQVLQQISNDFKLNFPHKKGRPSMTIYGDMTKEVEIPESIKTSIRVKKKAFTIAELDYWKDYGISITDLYNDNIMSLDHYWLIRDDYAYKFESNKDNPIFAKECKDLADHKYKIYRPFAEKGKRHLTNAGKNYIIGKSELPMYGDILVITKGIKDRLILKNLGYNCVAFLSESVFPETKQLYELKARFTEVFVFFDNDMTGDLGSERLKIEHKYKPISIPPEYNIKDISDFYKNNGKEKTEKLCQSLILEI